MLKYTKYVVISVLMVVLFASGCSDRGTNIPSPTSQDYIRTPQDFKVAPMVHVFVPEMFAQVQNVFNLVEMKMFLM